MNDINHSLVNRQFQFTSGPQFSEKYAPARLPGGRFAWPFQAADLREIAAARNYSQADLQAETSGFVT